MATPEAKLDGQSVIFLASGGTTSVELTSSTISTLALGGVGGADVSWEGVGGLDTSTGVALKLGPSHTTLIQSGASSATPTLTPGSLIIADGYSLILDTHCAVLQPFSTAVTIAKGEALGTGAAAGSVQPILAAQSEETPLVGAAFAVDASGSVPVVIGGQFQALIQPFGNALIGDLLEPSDAYNGSWKANLPSGGSAGEAAVALENISEDRSRLRPTRRTLRSLASRGFSILPGRAFDSRLDGDASHYQEAVTLLGKAAWGARAALMEGCRHCAVRISGGVLQLDVDALDARALALLPGVDEDALEACRRAFDYVGERLLRPIAEQHFEEPAERMPGRKLLVSGPGVEEQLPHMDSLTPSLVCNVYLRTGVEGEGDDGRWLEPTYFAKEPPGAPPHPRTLDPQDPALDGVFGAESGAPWGERASVGPSRVESGSACVFAGSAVHAGPRIRRSGVRIVLFQYMRPASELDVDLSDYQEQEFLWHHARYGPGAPSTLAALERTNGRWKLHFGSEKERRQFLQAV